MDKYQMLVIITKYLPTINATKDAIEDTRVGYPGLPF